MGKSLTRPQPYTKNYRQIKSAKNGSNSLLQGWTYQLVIPNQVASHKNMYKTFYRWSSLYLGICMYTYTYIHLCAITINERTSPLWKRKEVIYRRDAMVEREGKNIIIISKHKKKIVNGEHHIDRSQTSLNIEYHNPVDCNRFEMQESCLSIRCKAPNCRKWCSIAASSPSSPCCFHQAPKSVV